jgi:5-methylcytosine-specific restriction endonuclease McrA
MEVTKKHLHRLYTKERQTTTEIADMFGVTPTTVSNWLRKFNIRTRQRREAQVRKFEVSKTRLRHLYTDKQLSCAVIGNMYGYTDESVRRKLKEYGIQRRPAGQTSGGHNKGVPMSEEQRVLISQQRKHAYATGKLVYWNKGGHWSSEVKTKISNALKRRSKHKHCTTHYGRNWKQQRTLCLQRDNYLYQECGSTETLRVHHWVPYRFSFDNSLDNLITLCLKCHQEKHQEYIREGFVVDAEAYFYDKM